MIPDGTSVSAISLTRWYNYYKDNTQTRLAFDPYICGLVKTHSSNAPIGDSAPTMCAYVTGCLSQTGFIGMYPPADNENDLVAVDPSKAYSPRMSVGKAMQIAKNKAVGLVFTCEFPHATPANNFAYSNNRRDYPAITEQMAHNSIDVVIGGGAGLLTPDQNSFLQHERYTVILDDLEKFRNETNPKFWALFCDRDMPYDIDRDKSKYPSLQEMTKKAIGILSENANGFFLMVEGSKVDWAAHTNDPIGIISEMRAFDKAVAEAIEFAKNDGNTLVIVVPDHGNSGLSIGNSLGNGMYDKLTLSDIIEPLSHCKKTADGLTDYLAQNPDKDVVELIKNEWGITLSVPEINSITRARNNYIANKSKKESCSNLLTKVINSRSYIGFTTSGHTGEDVFLAVYHPQNNRPTGLITAPELNAYMCKEAGIPNQLDALTNEYFCKYTDLFSEKEAKIDADKLTLTIKQNKNTLIFKANSNVVMVNGKEQRTKTPAVFVNNKKAPHAMWYISKESLSFMVD
jgi:alkaline phosphatase